MSTSAPAPSSSTTTTRVVAHFVILLVVLLAANGLILRKEHVVRHGQTMLLELAPVDPRSLMQGDYMELRYDLLSLISPPATGGPTVGRIVVKLDPAHVATFARLEDGRPLAADEHLLQFRQGRSRPRLGAEAFFFQEGEGTHFSKGKYGELKVDANGSSVLIGLCDANRQRLAATAPAKADAVPAPAAAR